jgi:hypothetical protein
MKAQQMLHFRYSDTVSQGRGRNNYTTHTARMASPSRPWQEILLEVILP